MISTFDGSAFAATVGGCAGVIAVLQLTTFAISKIVGKHSVMDTTWGLLFAAVAAVAFLASAGQGDPLRRGLLLALPLIWGGRLAWHIARRSIGKPEDPRYQALLDKHAGNPDLYALRMIYGLQGLLALIIAAPIMVGAFEHRSVGASAWVGVAAWGVGLYFETMGDLQMERFRADPANKGKVIDTGLWRYTRHPNYFGDACVWWGIFLIAADAAPGILTILAPVTMTLLLTIGSGARTLERSMSQRVGWGDYAARTSMFLPWPPKSLRVGMTSSRSSR